jgi:hypothetical protein
MLLQKDVVVIWLKDERDRQQIAKAAVIIFEW